MKRFTMKIGICESEDKVENIYIIDPNLITEEFSKQKEKIRNPNATDESINRIAENIIKTRATQELGEYEDIKEEIGIDVRFLIKILSNEKGIWKKIPDTGEIVNRRAILICSFGKWCIYDKEWIYELKDYGKTWALTKEELEK